MDGRDVQQWIRAEELSKELGISIQLKGERLIAVDSSTKLTYGEFYSIKEVLAFLCGYDWAKSACTNR